MFGIWSMFMSVYVSQLRPNALAGCHEFIIFLILRPSNARMHKVCSILKYHPLQKHGSRNVPLGISFLMKPVSGLTIGWVKYVRKHKYWFGLYRLCKLKIIIIVVLLIVPKLVNLLLYNFPLWFEMLYFMKELHFHDNIFNQYLAQ